MNIKDYKQLKNIGSKLTRAGISERLIELMEDYFKNDNTYIGVIKLAGKIRALALSTRFDDYWTEKEKMGFQSELCYQLRQMEGGE